ncbi:multicopper oxidase domain-containing protein [Methylobacterium sp. JK268]
MARERMAWIVPWLWLLLAAIPVRAADQDAGWTDPPVLRIPRSSVVTLDAFTDWVDVPGLGRVNGASFYDIRPGDEPRTAPERRSLMPPVLQIDKGTVLDLHLNNRLTTIDAPGLGKADARRSGDFSNVHTHGLIVAPTGIGFGGPAPRLGDCVLPLAASHAGAAPDTGPHAHHAGMDADPCASGTPPGMAIADRLAYTYTIPADHPSGLFWIHPHPHGQSEIQLSNGVSGLLAIGSVWDELYFRCRLTASPAARGEACRTQAEQREERALEAQARGSGEDGPLLRVRYLGLKDVQVAARPAPAGAAPRFDLIPFPHRPKTTDKAFSTANDARKARCGGVPVLRDDGDVVAPGQVGPARGACWGKTDTGQREGWVFPVSGQVYPRITAEPDATELWRIANMSADVSYRLELKGEDGTPYRMRPIALDGVALAALRAGVEPGRLAGGKVAATAGQPLPEIVLMPSARIEVVVERCRAVPDGRDETGCVPRERTVRAVLRTRGMVTGRDGAGDAWPAIELAEVVFEAGKAGAPVLPRVSAAAPPTSLVASPSPAPPAASAPTPTDPCAYRHGPDRFGLDSTRVRLIRLKNDNVGPKQVEVFGIHNELFDLARDPDGAPVTVAALIDEGGSPPKDGTASLIRNIRLPNPCKTIDTPDGFHDYYNEFKENIDNVTVKYGADEYWLVVNDSAECHNFHIHQMKFAVVDADFEGTAAAIAGTAPPASDQCAGDRTAIRPINQAALLDNYPLPPSARVLFHVRFDGPKLGRFVFHCHILEHEDKGMMSLLKVEE